MTEARAFTIPAAGVLLDASLHVPPDACGLVVFAHGAGSDRHSPRNLLAADALHAAGYATLLFDLLTDEEKKAYKDNVFDIGKLTERLMGVTTHLGTLPETGGLKIAYLGASTGAAAALNAAARLGTRISAVVSRGGRPDLAEQDLLPSISAPTAFIIGEADVEVLEASRSPFDRLTCEKELRTVPDATHLFDEPGTLERATDLAVAWLDVHLS